MNTIRRELNRWDFAWWHGWSRTWPEVYLIHIGFGAAPKCYAHFTAGVFGFCFCVTRYTQGKPRKEPRP